jgi:methionine biosynthesis protein MetW
MSNYTENQYVAEKNNSWSMVYDLVPEGEKVLDIGCSSGNFGAELIKQKSCVVDGVDIDKKDIELARKKLRNAWVVDLEQDNLNFTNETYDALIMMDVIEHLKEPHKVLINLKKFLKPGGRLLFSVPNMSHISVRLDLLHGRFDYRQTGVLDDTHLHFYTEKYLRHVFKSAQYKVTKFECTSVTYPDDLLKIQLEKAGLRHTKKFSEITEQTNGYVYQFVGVAAPGASSKAEASLPKKHPHDEHYKEIEKVIRDQRKHIAHIEKEISLKQTHINNLEAIIKNYERRKDLLTLRPVRRRLSRKKEE